MTTQTLIISTDFSIHRKGCKDITRNGNEVAEILHGFQGTTWAELSIWYSAYWLEWTNENVSADEFLRIWSEMGDKKPCTGLK